MGETVRLTRGAGAGADGAGVRATRRGVGLLSSEGARGRGGVAEVEADAGRATGSGLLDDVLIDLVPCCEERELSSLMTLGAAELVEGPMLFSRSSAAEESF